MPYDATYPRDSAQETVRKEDWSGGVVTVLPPDRAPAHVALHLENSELRSGVPRTRRGWKRAHWALLEGWPLGEQVQGAGLVTSADVSGPTVGAVLPPAVLVAADNDLWLCAPNTVPQRLQDGFTTALQEVEFLPAFGRVYCLRGLTQDVVRYRYAPGEHPRPLRLPTAAGKRPLPPAFTGAVQANRLWLAVGGSRLVASDLLEEWHDDEADYFLNSGENDAIVRLWPFGEDSLLIFKERSVFAAYGLAAMDPGGAQPVQPRFERIAAAKGCVAPQSVAQIGGTVFYLSHDGVERLAIQDSRAVVQSVEPLSAPVQGYFDVVDWPAVTKARAVVHDHYYLLAVPRRAAERLLSRNYYALYPVDRLTGRRVSVLEPGRQYEVRRERQCFSLDEYWVADIEGTSPPPPGWGSEGSGDNGGDDAGGAEPQPWAPGFSAWMGVKAPRVELSCKSFDGSGQMWGFSKFINENDGDWNRRKYRSSRFAFANCQTNGASDRADTESIIGFDGSCTVVSHMDYRIPSGLGPPGCFVDEITLGPLACGFVLKHWYASPPGFTFATTETVDRVVGTPSGWSTTATEVLSMPDTVAAALARASAVEGASCTAIGTSIGTTTARAQGSLAVTAVAVRYTARVSNLEPGTCYRVRVRFDITDYPTPGNPSVEYHDHTFVATAEEETITGDAPLYQSRATTVASAWANRRAC